MDRISEFIRSILKDKKRLMIFAAAAIGILMMLIPFGNSDGKGEVSLDEYKAALEEEIAELCSRVEGVGRCTVCVTFAEGEQVQYRSSNVVSSTPPRVMGVAIVCEGAGSPLVRAAIIDCMTSLFDIGSNRVSVLEMRK